MLLGVTGYLFAAGAADRRAGRRCAWTRHLLLRLGGGELGLSHGERDLPARDPRARHRVFYAVGTGIGGVAGPWLFGALIETGSRLSIFGGYLFGAALMLAAAVIAWTWGVAAERKPLEDVARPLAFRD